MPDGGPATMIMTLGYDPAKKRFVGTFIGSMMTNLWVYEGELERQRADARRRGAELHRPEQDGEVSGHRRDRVRRPPHPLVAVPGRGRAVAPLHDRPLPPQK